MTFQRDETAEALAADALSDEEIDYVMWRVLDGATHLWPSIWDTQTNDLYGFSRAFARAVRAASPGAVTRPDDDSILGIIQSLARLEQRR